MVLIPKHELPLVEPAALAGLPTKVLLGRLRRLLRCEETAAASDLTPDELARVTGIAFKDTPEWQSAHAQVKAVLATREHVPKASERLTARTERARSKRSAEHRRR